MIHEAWESNYITINFTQIREYTSSLRDYNLSEHQNYLKYHIIDRKYNLLMKSKQISSINLEILYFQKLLNYEKVVLKNTQIKIDIKSYKKL